ncbi:MAG: hypothetical protein HY905_20685 [Deltaproteobacteria bacterium]|nr:hypothetical protein [Deltaproteobacteria bacterium]
MSNEPMRVHLLTRGAYYRGLLHYSDVPAASRPRLLDYLNSKARGRGPAGDRASILRLDDAEITVYQGTSKSVSQAATVSLVATAIVVAFDETRRSSTLPPPTFPTAYEQRMAQEKEPVLVLTRTRHRLRGIARGGVKRLAARTADESFVALTDVTIEDLSMEGRQPAGLPFVALNMDFVEAFWSV